MVLLARTGVDNLNKKYQNVKNIVDDVIDNII